METTCIIFSLQLRSRASLLMYIRRRDVLSLGYTRNCGKCSAIKSGRSWTHAHSAACRRRFARLLPDRVRNVQRPQCIGPAPDVVRALDAGESRKRQRLSLKDSIKDEKDWGKQDANTD